MARAQQIYFYIENKLRNTPARAHALTSILYKVLEGVCMQRRPICPLYLCCLISHYLWHISEPTRNGNDNNDDREDDEWSTGGMYCQHNCVCVFFLSYYIIIIIRMGKGLNERKKFNLITTHTHTLTSASHTHKQQSNKK